MWIQSRLRVIALTVPALCYLPAAGTAADEPSSWPALRSTFPSTGGGGITIKGYDPVIVGDRCVTTFMAVTPAQPPEVFSNVVEFDAVARDGGLLCTNGRWTSFDGRQKGTTPFQMFYKDGTFRAPR